MDTDTCRTPRKIFSTAHALKLLNSGSGSRSITPNYSSLTKSLSTRNASLHFYPGTPPSRFAKVTNPFEAALTDRLHLPLICSPSLFNRPNTPCRMSSSTFGEWTIDEVSSLKPADVEPHETQFESMLDPELEAKAQAAIDKFFREHPIVPSPVDTNLRRSKVILPKYAQSCTTTSNSVDKMCQTQLSLPPYLPKDVEDILRPYFSQTSFVESNQSRSSTEQRATEQDARDESLRRKLIFESSRASDEFDCTVDEYMECFSPLPNNPQVFQSRNFGSPQDTNCSLNTSISPVKNDSFGKLSPISSPVDAVVSVPNAKSIFHACSTPTRNRDGLIELTSPSGMVEDDMLPVEWNDEVAGDDMQSSQSSHGSQQCETPSGRRKLATNRKNLSLSFDECQTSPKKRTTDTFAEHAMIFGGIDSGFNERDVTMQSDNVMLIDHVEQNINVMLPSTIYI